MVWQFWLDVGGTFTDCLARSPDGRLLRRKVLSSGVVKGRTANASIPAAASSRGADLILDPTRNEPDGFWAGYTCRLIDERGVLRAESRVTHSWCDGRLQLDPPLSTPAAGSSRGANSYELLSLEEAPILAIRLFLGLPLDRPIPPCSVRLGTTRGTNALLTRRGAKTALVTTRGFRDILRIGYQNRPKLFELAIKKPQPLFEEVAEIDERIAADGSVLARPRDE